MHDIDFSKMTKGELVEYVKCELNWLIAEYSVTPEEVSNIKKDINDFLSQKTDDN